MKKFKFRLERILQYRNIVKDEKMRALLEEQHRLHTAERRLEELKAAALINHMEANRIASASQVQQVALYAGRLKEAISAQSETIEICNQSVQEAMNNYIEASKDVKTLDTLKDKRMDEYKAFILKEEEKILDESATQKGNKLLGQGE